MKKTFVAALVFAALGLVALPQGGWAQTIVQHRDHTITFDEPVALVNGVTLPAGTYLFVFPLPPQLNVTRVLSQDRSKVYATLQTISTQRSSSNGFDVVLVTEGSPNTPRTLKAWFCDGNKIGHEFIAEKRKG
ncbi:MAG TPA: hypothetical protein VI485_03075 [Vicinamibacterales bacterium]|nr:hypothetical protein [Vicinamibacterales bacterium]